MRKFLCLLAIVITLAATYSRFDIEDIVSVEEITFFVSKPSYFEGCKTTQSGIGYEIICSGEIARKIRNELKVIEGERADCVGDIYTAKEIIRKAHAEIILTQKLDNMTIYYCYSNRIKGYVEDGRNRINLQIAVRDDNKVIVGIPIILGSY